MKSLAIIFSVYYVFYISCKTTSVPVKQEENLASVVVTLLNGDTLHGKTVKLPKRWLTGDFKGSDVSAKIEVKTTRSWKTSVYKPGDIKGFQLIFPDGRTETFYSSSTNNFIPIKDFPWGNLSRRPAFLHYIAGKKLQVYKRYYSDFNPATGASNNPIEQYYLVKDNGDWFYFNTNKKNWKEELLAFVKDCPSLVEKIKNGNYVESSSYKIANDYDNCKN
jgi:hypothetical protein